jgi:CRISPR-associated protein Csm3
MKLLQYKKISGEILLITGLHIGGSKDDIRIGALDQPIIRNPLNDFPYIPGSSLKGKIRMLLEWHLGVWIPENGDPHHCTDEKCVICRLFGTTAKENTAGPGRVLFQDCRLTTDSENELKKLKEQKGFNYAEEKYENVINRRKGTTKDGGLRQIERVPAGISFHFYLDYRVFDTGDKGKMDMDYFRYIKRGMKLLENDALGGSGSRGYGRIKFQHLKDENSHPIDLEEVDLANVE